MIGPNAMLVGLYVVGAAAFVVSMWMINRRWHARTSILSASVMMMAAAVWLSFQVAELLCGSFTGKLVAVQGQFCSILVVSTAWLVWVLSYTRNRHWVTRKLVFTLLAIDSCIVALVLTNGHHGLIWQRIAFDFEGDGILHLAYGAGYWAIWAYLYAVFAVGIGLLGKAYVSAGQIYRWEVSFLLLASVVPWFFGLAEALDLSRDSSSRMEVSAVALSSTLAAWLLFRLRSRHVIPVARKAILDSLSDAVVVVDAWGHIIDANPAAHKTFRMDECHPTNRSLRSYWPEMPSLVDLKLANLAASQEVTLSLDATPRVYDLRTSSIRDGAYRTVCHIFVLRDITDRKRIEGDRDRFHEELQYARRLESLALFAGGMAHEFNNALTRMLGYTCLAEESVAADAPVVEHLRGVERQIARATELADQILAYSGRGRFMVEQVSLARLVRESEGLLRGSIGEGTYLEFRVPDTLPRVEADPVQLRLMLTHLVINAVESFHGYGNRIVVAATVRKSDPDDLRRTAYCHADAKPGSYAVIEVTDTGCGMDEGTLGRIFDPFFSTKFTGRGLGLSAVLGIVRGHRGWIQIDTEIGHGTAMRVAFPLAGSAAPRFAASAPVVSVGASI